MGVWILNNYFEKMDFFLEFYVKYWIKNVLRTFILYKKPNNVAKSDKKKKT